MTARSKNKNAVERDARIHALWRDTRLDQTTAEPAAAAAEATRVAADAHAQEVQPPMSTDALLDPSPSSVPTSAASDIPDGVPGDADVLATASAAGGDATANAPAADAAPVTAAAEPVAETRGEPVAGMTDAVGVDAAAVDAVPPAAESAAAGGPVSAQPATPDADVKARRDGLARMHNLLGRVEQLTGKTDLSLKAADRALRDVRAALAAIPPLPSRADYDDVHTRLKAVQDALAPKLHELREADEWQKWANVTIQEQLCAKMEALNALEDAEVIAREVRELQQQWRSAADVPRDKADALWRRFKTAHDSVWAKCEAHFAAEAQARTENLAKKTALCERAEALSGSTAWIQTAEAIKQLQGEWKTIGPVSRGREKAIWDRFRTACDAFFTRRNADLAQRKGVWAENLARKDALCVRAEALADSTDWDVAAAEIKQLQAEWKSIGPVKKSRSEAIWQRFRTACDRFFDRYAQRHNAARAERVAAREAICGELEALGAANEGADAPADLLSTVRALRGRWQAELAARGVDPDRAHALDTRFNDAFNALVGRWPAAFGGTDLDPDANRKRMEGLVKRVEDLAAALAGPAVPQADLSPVNKLAAMLKEALAANTIGGKGEDDSRWRAAVEDVRQAQAAWSRLGPVAEPVRRQLADRFQRAVRKITDRADAAARQSGGGRPPGRHGGGGPGGFGGHARSGDRGPRRDKP